MGRDAKPAKAKVEARPTVTRRSRKVDSSTGLQLKQRLADALEQHKAISEILQVISASPSDVQPVLDAVAKRALDLCDAAQAGIFLVDEDTLRFAARFGNMLTPEENDSFPLSRGLVVGRAVIDRETIHHADIVPLLDTEYPDARLPQQKFGFRALLGVPLMREDRAIGAIALWRMEARRFTDKQIALVKTFAGQAAIAIENVRLFKELEERNRDLTEALEQRTATSDILRVISQSPTDVQPVFDNIAYAALNLCKAAIATVSTFDGELIHLAAIASLDPEGAEALRKLWPRPPSRDTAATRAILTRTIVVIPDVLDEPDYKIGATAATTGFRSVLAVPLLREGSAIGCIAVGRPEPGPSADKQIALLQTFADQAVIAIENVRLFTELTHKNRQLTQAHAQVSEALEHQTATSEILRVISSSPTEVQPVFEIIGERAAKLCDAQVSVVSRVEGEQIHLVALHGMSEEAKEISRRYFPMPLSFESSTSRAVRSRTVVHLADVLSDAQYGPKDAARAGGWRSCLAVPMLREGAVIGAIFVGRAASGRFPDSKVELLKTFADQAVIAIQNVRLFNELQARTAQLTRLVGELKALGEVGQAVSSTLDLETVLRTIVSRANQLAGMDGGAIFEYDETQKAFSLRATDNLPPELVTALGAAPIPKGEGAIGRLAVTGEPVQIRDIVDESGYQSRVRDILIRIGSQSLLAVPLLCENRLLGGLVVNRKSAGEFAPEVIDLLKTFATQSALAIQNARLFREIEVKSRQLEVASQHKSEFLANMSHELRTPLNAIIGFSEVLSERMFGEINDKQAEYLSDILESGRHLLSLINDILDLSKIEAGRMELETADFDLPSAIESTLMLVRERAHRRAITLERTIDARLGIVRADERKVKQVLLNLLSNALKFTPEGGQIAVRAGMHNDEAEISVTDTGVGIAPEDQAAVFEEFRQVGAAAKKVEGTGLGLAISRKFIELHGGRIWVKSQVGSGSTFSFTLPV